MMSAALLLSTAARGAERHFELKIQNGRLAESGPTLKVSQGDEVVLELKSDRDLELHLHGYDIEKTVEPGAATEMAFTAHATGRFPVEEHKPNAKGGHSHGEAPLVRIEVRPR